MDHSHKTGTPWLDQPVLMHSSRKYTCSLNDTALCDWQQGYWRFWYEADHRFTLPTVAFFLIAIVLFSTFFFCSKMIRKNSTPSRTLDRVIAVNRYLSYKTFRIQALRWHSAPLGLLALAAVGTMFFFAMTLGPRPYYWPNTREISFGNSPPVATRSGWMSLACMPFVFATSTKSSLITAMTGVSHEKLQVFHRWISYAMYVLALIHTFPFVVFHVWKGDMVEQWNSDVTYWTGVVTLLAQTYLNFASISPLRNVGYEWFKFTHFLAALIFMLFYFFHCDFRLSSWDFFIATGVIYAVCWMHGQARTYFVNGIPVAALSLTSNGFIRVSVHTKTTWKPGQHYFVRFLSSGVDAISSHPFTACSLPTEHRSSGSRTSELVFYIRPKNGFTGRLARALESEPDMKSKIVLNGPFGGIDRQHFHRAERLILIAGGSGAGWLLPMIECFMRRLETTNGDVESEKVERQPEISMKVILATRDQPTQLWFKEAVKDLLVGYPTAMVKASVEIEIFLTNNENTKESSQFLGQLDHPERIPSVDLPPHDLDVKKASEKQPASVRQLGAKLRSGSRPDLPGIVADETFVGHRSVGIFLCGPLSMQHDVSNAVAKRQVPILMGGLKDVYLHLEHFQWA